MDGEQLKKRKVLGAGASRKRRKRETFFDKLPKRNVLNDCAIVPIPPNSETNAEFQDLCEASSQPSIIESQYPILIPVARNSENIGFQPASGEKLRQSPKIGAVRELPTFARTLAEVQSKCKIDPNRSLSAFSFYFSNSKMYYLPGSVYENYTTLDRYGELTIVQELGILLWSFFFEELPPRIDEMLFTHKLFPRTDRDTFDIDISLVLLLFRCFIDTSMTLLGFANDPFFHTHGRLVRTSVSMKTVENQTKLLRYSYKKTIQQMITFSNPNPTDVSGLPPPSRSPIRRNRRPLRANLFGTGQSVAVVSQGSDGLPSISAHVLENVLRITDTFRRAEELAEEEALAASLLSQSPAPSSSQTSVDEPPVPASLCLRVAAAVDHRDLAANMMRPSVLNLYDSRTEGTGIGRTFAIMEEFFDELVTEHDFFAVDENTDTLIVVPRGEEKDVCEGCDTGGKCSMRWDFIVTVSSLLAWFVTRGGRLSKHLHPAVTHTALLNAVLVRYAGTLLRIGTEDCRRWIFNIVKSPDSVLGDIDVTDKYGNKEPVSRASVGQYIESVCYEKMFKDENDARTRAVVDAASQLTRAFRQTFMITSPFLFIQNGGGRTFGSLVAPETYCSDAMEILVQASVDIAACITPNEVDMTSSHGREVFMGQSIPLSVCKFSVPLDAALRVARSCCKVMNRELCGHFQSTDAFAKSSFAHIEKTTIGVLQDFEDFVDGECARHNTDEQTYLEANTTFASLRTCLESIRAHKLAMHAETHARTLVSLVYWFYNADIDSALAFFERVTSMRVPDCTYETRRRGALLRAQLKAHMDLYPTLDILERKTSLVHLVDPLMESLRSSGMRTYKISIGFADTGKDQVALDWLPKFSTCTKECKLSPCTSQDKFNKGMATSAALIDGKFDSE